MQCPKCQFDHPLQTTECLKCGIVFSRYLAAQEAAASQAAVAVPLPVTQAAHALQAVALPSPAASADTDRDDAFRDDAVRELKCRALALPLALFAARLLVRTGFGFVAGMLAMLVHESGHAVTAWLTGRWAIPTLWVTMHGDERSWPVVLILASAICFGGFVAWKMERWGWLCIAGAALLLQLFFLSLPQYLDGALITFGGDGGALVLATILMAMFYAPRESAICRSWGLRWGLLVIGALAFMHVYALWSGPVENIPFGEIEGVNLSDPSLLTIMYGWSSLQLVDRYVRLAEVCLAALAALYVWGLVSAYLDVRSADAPR